MSNIRNILEVICKSSNEYLQNIDRRGDDWVVLSTIVDHDGSVNDATRDRVVMTLYNITRENTVGSYTPARQGGDSFAIVSPPIYVNLHLMFMANFSGKNYSDGLAAISRIISYFQQNPYFDQTNAPDLETGIERLTLDLENLSPVDVNYIMSMLGTKYLPAAFYKMRLLPFASNAMQARTYGVMSLGISEAPGAANPA
jgi:GGDEF domain-containing protein